MSIICRIKGHEPEPQTIRNQGLEFTRCRRCKADLVRRFGGKWSVPRRHRVRWPDGHHEEAQVKPVEQPKTAHRHRRSSAHSRPGMLDSDFMEQEAEELFGWEQIPFRFPMSPDDFGRELRRSRGGSGLAAFERDRDGARNKLRAR